MRALATSLAGDQLERLQAAGHTARGEWRAGRGAKDVAMQVTNYYLTTYYDVRGLRAARHRGGTRLLAAYCSTAYCLLPTAHC